MGNFLIPIRNGVRSINLIEEIDSEYKVVTFYFEDITLNGLVYDRKQKLKEVFYED